MWLRKLTLREKAFFGPPGLGRCLLCPRHPAPSQTQSALYDFVFMSDSTSGMKFGGGGVIPFHCAQHGA